MCNQASNPSVQDLIRRVRTGDPAAFPALLQKYRGLIGAAVARYGADLQTTDREDLRQTALLAFYRAVLNFNAAQNEVEFGLFAEICVERALISHLRVLRRPADEPLPEDVPGEGKDDPASLLLADEAAAELRARIRSALSPYENRVWDLYFAGRSAAEIATVLSKTTRSVENAVFRIRRKLRMALYDRG